MSKIECDKCGRKFKSIQALGGHVSRAHRDTSAAAQGPPQQHSSQAQAPAESGPPQAKSEAAAPQPEQTKTELEVRAAPEPAKPKPEAEQAGAPKSGPAPPPETPAATQPPAPAVSAAAEEQQPEAAPSAPGEPASGPAKPLAEAARPQPDSGTKQSPPPDAAAAAQQQPPAPAAAAAPQKGEEKAGADAPAAAGQQQAPPSAPAGQGGKTAAALPVPAGQPEQDEASRAELIRNYLKEGYTPEQLTSKRFGFKESTVRQEVAKLVPPEGEKPGNPNRLPMVLKAGAGQELISPESIIEAYVVPEDQAGKWMLRGFMLYRAAQLAVLTDVEIMKGQSEAQAKALKPVMDIMEQARADMDSAAQRAKESNTEIAEMAAAGAAARVMRLVDARFEEMKAIQKPEAAKPPDAAKTPDPAREMMARTMEMLMTRMMALLAPGTQVSGNPGFTDKRTQQGGKGQ